MYYKHSFVSILLATAFLFMMLPSKTALAEDVCQKAREIRKERLLYDSSARIKRVEIMKQIINVQTKIDDLDLKLADIQQKIVSASGEQVDLLWQEYDKLNAERDEFGAALSAAQQKHSGVQRERREKKFDLKMREIADYYECVINNPPTKSINDTVASGQLTKDKKPEDKDRLSALIDERNKLISSLKSQYQAFVEKRELTINKIKVSQSALEKAISDESKLDKEKDELNESLSNEVDNFRESLSMYDNELSAISKKILPFTSDGN